MSMRSGQRSRTSSATMRRRALFRREELVRSETDLGELLAEVSRIIGSDAVIRNVSLQVDVRHPLRPILVDRVQIQQAVINLLLNAFDAVSEAEEYAREVTLSAHQEDSGCLKLIVH